MAVISHLLGCEASLFLQFVPLIAHFGAGFLGRTCNHVKHLYLRLRLCGHLGNALAHGAGTDHTYFLKACIHSN